MTDITVPVTSMDEQNALGIDWTRAAPWLVTVGAWTLVGLLSVAQALAQAPLPIPADVLRRIILTPLLSVWVWALYTPAILELTVRLPLGRRRWPRGVALHIVAILATCLLDVLFDRLLGDRLTGRAARPFTRAIEAKLFIDSFSYAALVAVAQALRYARLYRARVARQGALEQQLLAAENSLLRMQLDPHFLYNTLNAIAELVHEDPDGADEMITRLGALLRASATALREPTITLGEELDFVEQYLGIMRVRLRGRLSVSILAPVDVRAARVPPLLLQPVVENALRHGIERRAGAGRLEIEARWEPANSDVLEIEVRDDGIGVARESYEPGGIGLTNTRRRLQQLYGARAGLVLRPRVPVGAIAAIQLPFAMGA